MLKLVSKDSVKISDHFDVLCVLVACMVLEIINQMSKNQKSSLIVWNTVYRQWSYERFALVLQTNCIQKPKGQIDAQFILQPENPQNICASLT